MYRAQVRLKGFEIQTATFERKTDAKRWASSKESALKEGRYLPSSESKKRTVKELCERYINQVLPDAKPKYRYSQAQQLNR